MCECFNDQLFPDPDVVRLFIDPRPRIAENRARLIIMKRDTDLAQDAQGSLVNRLQLVGRHHFDNSMTVDRLSPGSLRNRTIASARPPGRSTSAAVPLP